MLGENEPDPMTALFARLELGQRLLIDSARLGIDEALEVERIILVHRRVAYHELGPRRCQRGSFRS
jgi:hypothetical protein